MIGELVASVVVASSQEEWQGTLESCLADLSKIEALHTKPEICDICERHDLESYSAAILYHSTQLG